MKVKGIIMLYDVQLYDQNGPGRMWRKEMEMPVIGKYNKCFFIEQHEVSNWSFSVFYSILFEIRDNLFDKTERLVTKRTNTSIYEIFKKKLGGSQRRW